MSKRLVNWQRVVKGECCLPVKMTRVCTVIQKCILTHFVCPFLVGRLTRERESSSYQDGLMSSVQASFGSTKEHREMCVVVKADVQGSAEALTRALRELKLENDEATVTIKPTGKATLVAAA